MANNEEKGREFTFVLVKTVNGDDSWARNVDLKGANIVGKYKDMRFIIKSIDTDEKVSIDIVKELNGVMPENSNLLRIIVVSRGGFTEESLEFGKRNKCLILTDKDHLVSDLMDRYIMIKNEQIKNIWIIKLLQLNNIINGLDEMHQKSLIHCDFHHGNILNIRSKILFISNLGLCKPIEYFQSPKNNGIYGVLPFVAPKVLRGQPYTLASDIYIVFL
ncbi:20646_t:CDS:2 [Funneliformis geosporum]|nr:20646_t:CDS:2 [Funneliformis geosporum]